MEPEGSSVDVMTIAPGGSAGVLEEISADTEADTEAGEVQEPLELDGDQVDDV